MPWGSQAVIKVIAYNSYGDSEDSPNNSDVKLTALPADVTLSENMDLRTPTQIGLTWIVGFIGGTQIIEYRVSWDQSTGTYVVLQDRLLESNFLVTGLTNGVTYAFKVEARNAHGYSEFSNEYSVLVATVPD